MASGHLLVTGLLLHCIPISLPLAPQGRLRHADHIRRGSLRSGPIPQSTCRTTARLLSTLMTIFLTTRQQELQLQRPTGRTPHSGHGPRIHCALHQRPVSGTCIAAFNSRRPAALGRVGVSILSKMIRACCVIDFGAPYYIRHHVPAGRALTIRHWRSPMPCAMLQRTVSWP